MIHRRVRDHVAMEELVALGECGLVEAAARFDGSRGASFATFAWYRVRGAILDGMRRQAPLPRRVWRRLAELRVANEVTPESSPRKLEIESEISAIRTMYVRSLDECEAPPADDGSAAEQIDADRMATKLAEAIDKLPANERDLVRKHYWEDKDLGEAGADLGISRSWSCRLHARAIQRIRTFLDRTAASGLAG